ncbi:hypothetical protein [Hymenobacter cellulosilyticus]|uniref:Uncharacterized protein n=1 Tax=Hymenobacter cellulosilyticus TaxID=2932248 RepID=A0A8T9Q2P0_9BACT|nr:hypothetical protein [Hymenobacter cellulosilyticus]UOQ71232.1 hypothetical protein MUN79_21655 [Hymenobacter cellulosilyticus]
MLIPLDNKSLPIQETIRQLVGIFSDNYFDIVDHWTDDPEAIGIAHPDNHGILVYISTADLQQGYYVELEAPSYQQEFPYWNKGSYSSSNMNAVAAIVFMHFNMNYISHSAQK